MNKEVILLDVDLVKCCLSEKHDNFNILISEVLNKIAFGLFTSNDWDSLSIALRRSKEKYKLLKALRKRIRTYSFNGKLYPQFFITQKPGKFHKSFPDTPDFSINQFLIYIADRGLFKKWEMTFPSPTYLSQILDIETEKYIQSGKSKESKLQLVAASKDSPAFEFLLSEGERIQISDSEERNTAIRENGKKLVFKNNKKALKRRSSDHTRLFNTNSEDRKKENGESNLIYLEFSEYSEIIETLIEDKDNKIRDELTREISLIIGLTLLATDIALKYRETSVSNSIFSTIYKFFEDLIYLLEPIFELNNYVEKEVSEARDYLTGISNEKFIVLGNSSAKTTEGIFFISEESRSVNNSNVYKSENIDVVSLMSSEISYSVGISESTSSPFSIFEDRVPINLNGLTEMNLCCNGMFVSESYS